MLISSRRQLCQDCLGRPCKEKAESYNRTGALPSDVGVVKHSIRLRIKAILVFSSLSAIVALQRLLALIPKLVVGDALVSSLRPRENSNDRSCS